MPGYMIHLTEAKLVLDILRKRVTLEEKLDSQWEKMFLCGNLLPDAVPRDKKKYSHFWDEREMDNILIAPCMSKFLDKYKLALRDPLLCGYFTHLYLDKMFYTDYIGQWISFYNENDRLEQKKERISYAIVLKKYERVSISQLFSEEYIYRDYTMLNEKLFHHYSVQVPWDFVPDKISIEEETEYDLKSVFKELKMFLEENHAEQKELKVFSERDLDHFLVRTAQSAAAALMDS